MSNFWTSRDRLTSPSVFLFIAFSSLFATVFLPFPLSSLLFSLYPPPSLSSPQPAAAAALIPPPPHLPAAAAAGSRRPSPRPYPCTAGAPPEPSPEPPDEVLPLPVRRCRFSFKKNPSFKKNLDRFFFGFIILRAFTEPFVLTNAFVGFSLLTNVRYLTVRPFFFFVGFSRYFLRFDF